VETHLQQIHGEQRPALVTHINAYDIDRSAHRAGDFT